eukprot:TRINITY_DN48861_c0_g1_i1.p1 TRINITY_DN48861_c0_g1~~TRINITY_DN48861_c0_g1_i1.p1  ORF type:complete len:268 (-),score=86.49 TRINITY_DN48861_c0_g1_i1:126-929(-)
MPSGFAALVEEEKAAKQRRKEEKLAKKKAEILEGIRAAARTEASTKWAEAEDEEDEEDRAEAEAKRALENDASDDSDGDVGKEQSDGERNVACAPVLPQTQPIKQTQGSAPKKSGKSKKGYPAEDDDIEALLAKLEVDGASGDEQPKEQSKAAARRAKKKAQAADAGDSKKEETPLQDDASHVNEDAPDHESVQKSPDEVRAMMKAKAAAVKDKKKPASGSAAAVAAAEAKAREADKKKKAGQNYQKATGKQVGPKARGSDAKYQGE